MIFFGTFVKFNCKDTLITIYEETNFYLSHRFNGDYFL